MTVMESRITAESEKPEPELRTGEIVGYSLGGFAKNIAFILVSTYTLFYYNDVLKVNSTFVGTMLMVARIFDAFNDPLMGVIVSKTNSRLGKYKPWILSGAILNSLIIVAMFTVPQHFSPTQTKFYISITYFLCGITYTLSDIPYWAVIPAITKPGKSRETITVLTRLTAGIGAGLTTAFAPAIITKIGESCVALLKSAGPLNPLQNAIVSFLAKTGLTESAEIQRIGYSIFAVIVAIAYSVLTLISVLKIPKEKYPENSSVKVKDLFRALIKNDQVLSLTVILVLFYAGSSITLNLAMYIFKYDLQMKYTPYIVTVGLTQLFSMAVLYPLLRKKFSNRKIFMIGLISGFIGYTVLTVLIFVKKISFLAITIPSAMVGITIGLGYILITIFIANAVDYGESKTGQRQNSLVSSVQTFISKMATSIAVFLTGIGLDWINYAKDAANPDTILPQLAQTITKGRFCFAVPPLILMVVAFILLKRRKDL